MERLHQHADLRLLQLQHAAVRFASRRIMQRIVTCWHFMTELAAKRRRLAQQQLERLQHWHASRCLQTAFLGWRQLCWLSLHVHHVLHAVQTRQCRQLLRRCFTAWCSVASQQQRCFRLAQQSGGMVQRRMLLQHSWHCWTHSLALARQGGAAAQRAFKLQEHRKLCSAFASWRHWVCELSQARKAGSQLHRLQSRSTAQTAFQRWLAFVHTRRRVHNVLKLQGKRHDMQHLHHALSTWQLRAQTAHWQRSVGLSRVHQCSQASLARVFLQWRNAAQHSRQLRHWQLQCSSLHERHHQQSVLRAWHQQHWARRRHAALTRCGVPPQSLFVHEAVQPVPLLGAVA